ncbi:MAG TPA: RES family NAD+ phosphorylase [Pusillimonas sp.]|uniref:RES family NAD+ phosphorylase n=1 Tax=unclassified Pusillimonas TaxID=2640016 RepID=UPI00260E400F|nr:MULTISPECIES: RES family NAD+ phosphorylase [unclassified Pusillimonas]HLU19742.1 RES family NAD+ phosphorylase [Pusillimonas sp.]
MPALPPTALVRQLDTYRLLPSRFADQEDSVLAALSESADHLADLFVLDNATNQRLRAERGGLAGIGIDELVFGVPNFRIVNAAFTYPRPEGSRFNTGERGAWYCAFDVQTALAEIVFHKTVEYAEIDYFHDSVSYQALLADFSAEFHDLRDAPLYAGCLDPFSYVTSQELAQRLLDAGSMGVVYPSVRRPAGTNLACFRPALVGNVRRGPAYSLTWSGPPEPVIEQIS